MIDLERFDLTSEADVKRLADVLARDLTNGLAPFAAAVSEEFRGIFWAMVLAGPYGAMWRSVGAENAEAIAALWKKVASEMDHGRALRAH